MTKVFTYRTPLGVVPVIAPFGAVYFVVHQFLPNWLIYGMHFTFALPLQVLTGAVFTIPVSGYFLLQVFNERVVRDGSQLVFIDKFKRQKVAVPGDLCVQVVEDTAVGSWYTKIKFKTGGHFTIYQGISHYDELLAAIKKFATSPGDFEELETYTPPN